MWFRLCFFLASLSAALSVVFGAFLAHGLKNKLSEYYLNVFETATRYQMYHAFALFILAFILRSNQDFLFKSVAVLFFMGILIFCGSLYLLVITGVKSWGAVTPVGGLCFILGWLLLAYSSFKLI